MNVGHVHSAGVGRPGGDPLALLAGGLSLLLAVAAHPVRLSAGAEPALDFAAAVAPIFGRHCVRCHSPGQPKGDISLATGADLAANQYVVPGDPDSSYLVELIAGDDGRRPEMPKEGAPLSAEQVATIRRWIAEGAPWPAEVVVRERSQADASWWSLQPLARPEPPTPAGIAEDWLASPIDRFIFARLDEQGLRPNPPADRRTLIRRATFDLTGLPPTPDEVAAFVADPDPRAYERLVDRLLESPHYGQRWGRHWLDVVRFGESNGFERNVLIHDLWPFRDYVIRSLNEDKPFDQFVREHLAGDVLGPNQPEVEIGSAFLVAGPYDNVGNQDAVQAAQIRADAMDEMIRATGEAFLGLTIGCARCHDHKFDPLSQRDYYGWYATFAGVRHGSRELASAEQRADRAARLAELQQRRAALQQQHDAVAQAAQPGDASGELAKLKEQLAEVQREIAAVPPLPTAWVGTRVAGEARGPFHLFLGGSPQRKGDEVWPASLAVLDRCVPPYRLEAASAEGDRRRALAEWITHPDNPLAPRVLANRLWHYHFGTGIVDTPSDFGYMGGRPTHPELLDWLAGQVHVQGWRLKPLHRLIMSSQTYRQSSGNRADAAAVDSAARLLWRFPPRRLSAEEIRDTLLSVAGKLDARMGGPGFRLYRHTQDNVCTYVPLDEHGPETYRRAVYHQNVRASVVDLMSDFDQPDCAFATPRRAATTPPLQALTMLNHRFTLDMARALAERLEREAGEDVPRQIGRAFELCYGRSPTEGEWAACRELVAAHSLAALGRVLFNTSELLYVE